jgi:hypothetical protein
MSTSPRTQKAKGVFELAHRGLTCTPVLIASDAKLEHLEAAGSLPWTKTFARPCPMRPRHGFVESRLVADMNDVRKIWAATKAADPDGELLLTAYVNAQQSAVVTPAAIVIGKGHDGATSGAAGSVVLPLAHVDLTDYALESLGVYDTPYIESVQSKSKSSFGGGVTIVQIRDGARPPETLGNFVPADVTVTEVLNAGNDLLVWEQLIKEAAPGTVAHHPGGNLLSHYSVHAVTHGVPIVFDSDAPKVGDVLKATSAGVAEFDIEALCRGIAAGMGVRIDGDHNTEIIRIVFFALHQSAALKTTAAGCQVIGIAAALFARFTTAACLGELRHYKYGKGYHRGAERHQVYSKVFEDYATTSRELRQAWKVFFTGKWPSNFGGKRWAQCTYETIKLDRAIYDVCNSTEQAVGVSLLAQLNINVNLAHNGGWWLNKFCTKSTMDAQACGYLIDVLQAAYAVAPMVNTAAQTTPAVITECVPLPVRPLKSLQLRLGTDHLYLQYGNRHEHVTDTISLPSRGKRHCDVKSLLEIFRLPTVDGFGTSSSSYLKPTMAFMAALELTDEKLYAEIKTWIAKHQN